MQVVMPGSEESIAVSSVQSMKAPLASSRRWFGSSRAAAIAGVLALSKADSSSGPDEGCVPGNALGVEALANAGPSSRRSSGLSLCAGAGGCVTPVTASGRATGSGARAAAGASSVLPGLAVGADAGAAGPGSRSGPSGGSAASAASAGPGFGRPARAAAGCVTIPA